MDIKALTEGSISMAQQARALVAKATERAEWAASVVQWATTAAAIQHQSNPMSTVASESSTGLRRLTTIPHTQPSTAIERVFDVTELMEAILAQKAISIRQLFQLQRVNKHFANIIAGSIRLRKKLWLNPVPTDENEQDFFDPLLHVDAERFQIFDGLSFDNENTGDICDTLYSVQLCWDRARTTQSKRRVMALLMAFAAGNAIKPGSWENILIYRSGADTTSYIGYRLIDHGGEMTGEESGTTLGEWMRALAVISMRDLEAYFAEIAGVIDGVRFSISRP